MGMFDTIHCEVPLPVAEHQSLAFQTKNLECLLDSYTITGDGRLVRHARRGGIWGARVDHDVEATPEELGRAAVKAARRRSRAPSKSSMTTRSSSPEGRGDSRPALRQPHRSPGPRILLIVRARSSQLGYEEGGRHHDLRQRPRHRLEPSGRRGRFLPEWGRAAPRTDNQQPCCCSSFE